jgi:hypothetical protein
MQPVTKIGQVAWAWRETEAALVAAMKPREVWEAARQDRIEMPYAHFRVYISRLWRRRSAQNRLPPAGPSVRETDLSNPATDPFRNLREHREKEQQAVFEYDPLAINKNLIE